jgi:pyridoxal phosphate enzyme (YggS family)
MPSMSIAQNLVQVRERINAAARRAGRRSEDIALMAVSKMFPAECIREAYDAGLRLFGESRVQELGGKIDSLSDLPAVEWHLIGHLQTNKAAKAVELFASVDSVDSLRLAQKLDASARQVSKKIGVLIEINIGGEAAKSG